MSLCEKNCIFINYDTTTKNVECQCKIKTTLSLLSNLYKNQTNLLYNFDINNEENNESNSGNNNDSQDLINNSSINISILKRYIIYLLIFLKILITYKKIIILWGI